MNSLVCLFDKRTVKQHHLNGENEYVVIRFHLRCGQCLECLEEPFNEPFVFVGQ